MSAIDLTPFGFTQTESRLYGVLLQLGPATGYAVAQAARLARANAYAALDGLVTRGAAIRAPGRPARYRPADPHGLLASLALRQGEALDRLGQALERAGKPGEPEIRAIDGARALANLVLQVVARAERSIAGVVTVDLLRATLPAGRRAAERATVDVRAAGDVPSDLEAFVKGGAAEAHPTVLLVDDRQVISVTGAPTAPTGIWSSHPALVTLARLALAVGAP